MDRKQVKLVKASWSRLDDHAAQVIDSFYTNLFTAHPEMRSAFPADLTAQKAEAASVVDVVIGSLSFIGFVAPLFRPFLGHLWEKYPSEYVDAVGEAVVVTMTQADAAHWSDELRDAWAATWQAVVHAFKG